MTIATDDAPLPLSENPSWHHKLYIHSGDNATYQEELANAYSMLYITGIPASVTRRPVSMGYR
jgi:hypothetical protein